MAIIIILSFTLLSMWACVVLCYRTGAVENGKYLLGITLPAQYRREVEVLEILADYRRAMRMINLAGLAACMPVLMLNVYLSVAFLAIMIWFGLLIYFHQKNVTDCAGRLYRVKQEKGWLSANPHIVRVDTVLSSQKDRGACSVWWLLPPCLIAAGSCLGIGRIGYEGAKGLLFWVLPVSLFCAEAFLVFAVWGVRHARSQVYCSDSAANRTIDRVVRHEWGICMILHAWGTALLGLYAAWCLCGRGKFPGGQDGMVSLALLLLCATGSLFSVYRAYERVKRVKEQVFFALSKENGEVYGDDDEYWLNGYPAGKRPSGLTEKRIGIGWTTSASLQGDPTEKAVLILTGIVTIAICLFLMPFDFAHVELEISGTECHVGAASMGSSFDLADVEEITLLQERPSMSKRNGFDSNRCYLGDFRVQGYGTCKVYLYLRNDSVIRVVTPDRIIWFNGENEEETRTFYERLMERYSCLNGYGSGRILSESRFPLPEP